MSTVITTWGNSEAIRVPKNILRKAGLGQGDVIDFEVNEAGRIEIIPQSTYREGARRKQVTFNALFRSYKSGPIITSDPWDAEGLIRAEEGK